MSDSIFVAKILPKYGLVIDRHEWMILIYSGDDFSVHKLANYYTTPNLEKPFEENPFLGLLRKLLIARGQYEG